MPVYDYTCSACHRITEVIHGINDRGPIFCPECGAEGTMTKAFVAPAVHFKGSGWAKKDRGSSARASARKADEGGGTSTETKSTTESSSGTETTKADSSKSGASGGGTGTSTTDASTSTTSSSAD